MKVKKYRVNLEPRSTRYRRMSRVYNTFERADSFGWKHDDTHTWLVCEFEVEAPDKPLSEQKKVLAILQQSGAVFRGKPEIYRDRRQGGTSVRIKVIATPPGNPCCHGYDEEAFKHLAHFALTVELKKEFGKRLIEWKCVGGRFVLMLRT